MTEWYKVFFPCIFNKPRPIRGKGLAMAIFRPQDLEALGVSWWEWYP